MSWTFPIGNSLRWEDLDADPYPVYAKLREQEPVSRARQLGMWLVTRRADAVEVLTDTGRFTTASPHSTIRMAFGAQMLSAEGAQHAEYKSLAFPPFRPEALEARMLPFLRAKAHELIDRFGANTELRASFANPMAVLAIGEIVGIPVEMQAELAQSYAALSPALANFAGNAAIDKAGEAAAESVRGMLRECLRFAPSGHWPLTAALRGVMSEAEAISNCMVILFGGIETTEAAILNAMWALLTHPEQAAMVLREPTLVHAAIEESLRWEPAVQSCTRHAVRRTAIRDRVIEAGETIQCLIGAANRDPAFFEEPDRFDLRRANATQHLTFGYGRHACLGAALARMNLGVSVGALLERVPEMSLNAANSLPPRGYEFRKPPALTITAASASGR